MGAVNLFINRVDKIQKDHIYHSKQYQTFYRKIKYDSLNLRGVQKGYHQGCQYLMISIQFFSRSGNANVKFNV